MDGLTTKNILILSDAFPPAFNPRMGYLCKYLPDFGWNTFILTEFVKQNIYNNLSNNNYTNYLNFYWSKKGKINKLKYIFVFLADFFFNYKDIVFTQKAKKIIKHNNILLILASVSWKAFPALTAKRLGKKYKIPYMVDFRDIYEQFPNHEYTSKNFLKSSFINKSVATLIQKKYKIQRNKIIESANAVSTISEWHTQKLKEWNQNTHLIYNGFDADLFYFKPMKSEIFKITYTGRIESEAIKDPTLLFEAITYLIKNKTITSDKLKLQFYLLNQSSKIIIEKITEKYNLTNYVAIFDSVENEKIPDILNESSILLLLANTTIGDKTPKGIMGTKVFEYIAVEKPVLCVRNDNSCLEKTINETKSGTSASTIEEVVEFFWDKYKEWEENGFTHQNINKHVIEKYSRKYQAKQFVDIFEKLVKSCCTQNTLII